MAGLRCLAGLGCTAGEAGRPQAGKGM